MPKVNVVQKAQKEYKCGRCGAIIAKGQSYKWAQRRYGSKMLRCTLHTFRQSELTSSDKLATVYGALEGVEDDIDALEPDAIGLEDLAASLESSAEEIRNIGEEYAESASNMEEYFSGSQQIDDIREKAEACEELASELESAASDIRELDDTLRDFCANDGETPEEAEQRREDIIEEARSRASEAVGSSSL